MVFHQNGEAYQKKVKQEFKGNPSNHPDDTPASTRQQVSNTKRMAVIIYPRYNTCCHWSIIVLLVYSTNLLRSLYWKQQNLKIVCASYGSRKSPCPPHQGFLGNSKGSLKPFVFKGKSEGLYLGGRGRGGGGFKPKRPYLGGTQGYRYFLQQHIALVGLTYG